MGSVIDHVGCQVEPWKGPESVPQGDAARYEGSQIREDSHVGPWDGRREQAVLAARPVCYQRYDAAADEGRMVGGRANLL